MSARRPYKIKWSAPAAEDLDEIVTYIARQSPSTAKVLLARFKKTAANLASMPERGHIVPELQNHGISIYRELILAPWRIIYRIDGQQVNIAVVIDGRRNVEDVLLRRLTRTL